MAGCHWQVRLPVPLCWALARLPNWELAGWRPQGLARWEGEPASPKKEEIIQWAT